MKIVRLILYSKEEIFCILLKRTKEGVYYINEFFINGFIPIDNIKYIDIIGDVIE